MDVDENPFVTKILETNINNSSSTSRTTATMLSHLYSINKIVIHSRIDTERCLAQTMTLKNGEDICSSRRSGKRSVVRHEMRRRPRPIHMLERNSM